MPLQDKVLGELGRAGGKCPVCWGCSRSVSLVCICSCKSPQHGAELSHPGFPPNSNTVEISAKLGLTSLCRHSCDIRVLTCPCLKSHVISCWLARDQCSVRQLHVWNDLWCAANAAQIRHTHQTKIQKAERCFGPLRWAVKQRVKPPDSLEKSNMHWKCDLIKFQKSVRERPFSKSHSFLRIACV